MSGPGAAIALLESQADDEEPSEDASMNLVRRHADHGGTRAIVAPAPFLYGHDDGTMPRGAFSSLAIGGGALFGCDRRAWMPNSMTLLTARLSGG